MEQLYTHDGEQVPVRSAIRHSEQVDKILPAMLKAQKTIEHAQKDSENPHFHSSYASLNAYIDACKKAYNDNDIVVIQGVGGTDELVIVATQLAHTSGQWYECEMSGAPEKSGPQPKGSVITYFRRYTLSALGFMGAEDDDGNAGQAPPKPKKSGTKKQGKKETDENEKKLAAEAAFNTAWEQVMESIGEDDADNIKALRRHFFKSVTEKSSAFLAMSDSTAGMNSKEVKLITAMLTKGDGLAKTAAFCLGEWREKLGLPSLGVMVCEVCGNMLTEAEKTSCAIAKLPGYWCTKHVAAGVKKAQEAKSESG